LVDTNFRGIGFLPEAILSERNARKVELALSTTILHRRHEPTERYLFCLAVCNGIEGRLYSYRILSLQRL